MATIHVLTVDSFI